MRRLSPYVTRLLVATPLSANAVTALMIPVGLLAALCLTLPGLPGAVGAALLVQLWLLLDCCDGEVARWRRTFSPLGTYLDGVSHSVTQAAIPAALGIRADGGWSSIGGWTAVGLLAALLVLFVSLESHPEPPLLVLDHGSGVSRVSIAGPRKIELVEDWESECAKVGG